MHKLPELPWAKNALEPMISEETIEFHYGKHHNAYVTKLNAAIENTEYQDMPLEDIIKKSSGGLFNNAAQVWNHTFYWNCLAPNAGGEATGEVATKINEKWGNFENFKKEFTNSALTNFASGWTWLVLENNELAIVNTDDAETPISGSATPLLTIDVWEHAYYVDCRNNRGQYVENFWKLVNWDFVNSQI